MNRYTQLIYDQCPNGVEYRKIKDVFRRLKGTPITAGKMKEIENPNGNIKIFAGGKTVINANEEDIPNANITRVPAVLVQSRGIIDVVYYDQPFTFKNEMWAYTNENKITVRYLYYYLKKNIERFREAASGMGSLPQISLPVTEEFFIPVPPLPVQAEIVRILDKFTQLEAELEAQLHAELEARRKQYEHYRDVLLSFDMNGGGTANCEWKSIKDVCTVSSGGDLPKESFSEHKTDIYNIPIISNGIGDNALYGYTSIKKITEPAVTIAARGTIGYAEYRDYYYYPIIRLLSLIPKDKNYLNTKYLYYVLQGQHYDVPKSGIPQLTSPMMQKVLVPIPPIKEQARIVSILDRFDALCNDITQGLPAEIDARRKQYEYYRDKLLTFQPLA